LRARLELWLRAVLVLAGLHSLVLGFAMLFLSQELLRLLGWHATASQFFPAQSGLFLLILGGVYLAALGHRPLAWILVGSKAAAVVFLVVETAAGNCPEWMLFVATLDGAMGVATAGLLLASRRIVFPGANAPWPRRRFGGISGEVEPPEKFPHPGVKS
jgi:hypothetical protein